nr:hypothetical protein [Tanacetum cinerariifolium]
SDDESFEDIEYVDASVPDPAIVSVEEENVVHREEEEVDLEDISQVQNVVLCVKLFSITRLISNIESLNDKSTLDQGDIRFLEELLIDDSILSHESLVQILRKTRQIHDLLQYRLTIILIWNPR